MKTADHSDQMAKRDAALKKANIAYVRLVERIKQAGTDGYDVLNPDVLAEMLLEVARAQLAAAHPDFVEQCELFAREYERHLKAIDERFPPRIH
jgi:hypothetical protein